MAISPPSFERLPCPTVLLLHELPDGSSHVDWLIGRDAEGTEPMYSFRLAQRLDAVEPGQTLNCEQIADHRPHYLTYEGEVSGDRGRVSRLSRGALIAAEDALTPPISLDWQIRWEDQPGDVQHLRLVRYDEYQWIITCTQRTPADNWEFRATKEVS